MSLRLRVLALVAVFVSLAASTRATAQAPTTPAEGAQITQAETVLRWTLADGWHTRCLEWAARPETASNGGRFLEPSGSTCDLAPTDVAYLLKDLELGRYYWHVEVERQSCDSADLAGCRTDDAYGPTASFEVVPPPLPRGCTPAAAKAVGDEILLPYALDHFPRYFEGIEGWSPVAPVCRDLNGDGDREMVVRELCCTGGSISPWAIFVHDRDSGAWKLAYAQIRDTVFRLKLLGRVVRTTLPAPYEGACTRWIRYREVRWSGGRFRSRLTHRRRVPGPC
ncbi:MAG TPA: hypothetical protein VK501_08380 [Baekduia sp.]|uniref:hypothetical protein n=1 Tax=Baekduia sp. TaxID=2600305 RepID=UPI002B8BA0EA|nr:hypothetical protein [Baekduia sp.]HMJ33920.1 hypothetical protein [Baekduia sp.]